MGLREASKDFIEESGLTSSRVTASLNDRDSDDDESDEELDRRREELITLDAR